MGIWNKQGAIPNEPGAIFKIQFNVTKTKQSMDTKRLIFFGIYFETCKITPEGNFTANVRISVFYYIFVT